MSASHQVSNGVGGRDISSEDLPAADRADLGVGTVHESGFPQNRLDPLVEARLTEVVHGLRKAWIAHMAGFWSDIHPIDKVARSDFEKRIATTLSDGFFQFSQFLCGFEVLTLQLRELGIVSEQTVLSLEQLLVDLAHRNSDLVEISKSHRGLAKLLRGIDGCSCDRDKAVIHGDPCAN
jgi:hypothetical protein